ncbi:MAG TPA: hypothetical protein VJV78_27675 [Polyangiales bacterium]|nr:hypothetical protein [Polyangiales bacterium]
MLHIVYRSYGGENKKGRPFYYSKLVALLSLVRAVAEFDGDAEIIYLNDGPIPSDRLRAMHRSGEVVAREGLGMRGSMRAALSMPIERGWAEDDVVWFAEDDYLYAPGAIRGLAGAAEKFPEADYFALYALIGERLPNGGIQPSDYPVPPGWRAGEPRTIDGHAWTRALSTTSTFGARIRPLLEDRGMMYLAMWSGGGWDHTTCMLYQGHQPFIWPTVVKPMQQPALSRVARGAVIGAIRGGLNAWQAARTAAGYRSRTLIAPDPALATHLETEHLALGTDWAKVADDAAAWASGRGLAPIAHAV